MLDNEEVREEIKRVLNKYPGVLLGMTIRNIQLSVDVELSNRPCRNRSRLEQEIRSIKGVRINDIFYKE